MDIEQLFDEIFCNDAKRTLARQKNKIFDYRFFVEDGFVESKLVKEGKCKVIDRDYSRVGDCEIIKIKDIQTGEILTQNQFLLTLTESK